MLNDVFINLVLRHSDNSNAALVLWQEIEKAYTTKGRHYHNLTHLENMYAQLLDVKQHIADWDTLLFSLFYHDVVYNAAKKDNEEKSAALAVKRLTEINYPAEKTVLCFAQIIATKKHGESTEADTNFFTDADLSILGAPLAQYEAYGAAVRKEYSIYPDFLYKPGRKKALQHFLEMGHIYKTTHFQEKLEAGARANIAYEIAKL